MPRCATYTQLLGLARHLRGPNKPELEVFGDVGLYLIPPGEEWNYDATPLNVDTFATTAGDGTHFSFLQIPSIAPNEAPVLMTVPMADKPNYILGASLTEFLALGCRRGFYAIDELAYSYDEICAFYQSTESPRSDDLRLLTAITERFGLIPWPDVATRLPELCDQFIHVATPRSPEFFK